MNQNIPDAMPALRSQQWILWSIFFVTLPLRMYTNWLAFGAILVGLFKRHGLPKFNKEYVQKIIFDENLQMLPYLGVVAMAGSANFILYMPVIIHGYLEVSPLFKDYIEKGVAHKPQLIELKSDIEIYIGLYLIAVWFVGWSSLITILMYWQIMRVRYMMSAHSQAAFRRIDQKIKGYTASPRCPSIVRGGYLKVTGMLGSMAEMEGAQGAGAGRGGLMSKCNIF
ncbi:hypothetical protein FGO68_gene678 [Halteria grandinella]|uniref:Uncharacterized protein n=1 Tax=Halteria grandinella TaxID=5974 RepID=A0A8J8T002_HALGN|nr:hypothetical protein FGO68_gene678 [Halteria grandinella]